MRLLAFDTSGAAISAVAGEDGLVRVWRHEPIGRGQAERLLPLLREVMAEAGWAWGDLGLVAVATGPGTFTGLRAGISVARALGLALGCPVLGVGTLEVVAAAAMASRPEIARPWIVAIDARREEAYTQRFAADSAPLGPPAVVALQDLPTDEACMPAGDASVWAQRTAGTPQEIVEASPDARYLADVAWRRVRQGAVPMAGVAPRPLYVRPPDARISAGASLVAAVP